MTTTTPFDTPTTPKATNACSSERHFWETDLSATNSPLPILNWADRKEVWKVMIEDEIDCKRSPDCFDRHPNLVPSMRGILLDWMMEVR